MSTSLSAGVKRPAIWAALRAIQPATAAMLAREAAADPRTVRSYLNGLVRAGHAEVVPHAAGPRGGAAYRAVDGAPKEAPRVTPAGAVARQGEAQERLWRTVKMLSAFTRADLRVHAEVSKAAADSYCSLLVKAGYLRASASSAAQRTYRLVPSMNTGRHPPQKRRDGSVYDPNRKAVVWAPEAAGHAA